MSYFKSIIQDVKADPNNVSETNLEGWGQFIGTGSTTLGVVGLQVSLKTDRDCRVFVDQSPDNINWDIVDEFNYSTYDSFGITVQAVNSYVRVRVNNLENYTTSFFRLQTALCPIVEALPRSLDKDGNLKTSAKMVGQDDKDIYHSVKTDVVGKIDITQSDLFNSFQEMVKELKKINVQLSLMTDTELNNSDI